jgi:DNA polymerase III subunit epsilon
LSDARACGHLYNSYLKNEINFEKIEQSKLNKEQKNKKYKTSYPTQHDSEVLIPDFENAVNKTNPFYMKKVVISGFLDHDKLNISNELKKFGADIDTAVGKNTNFLILGDTPGPSKIEKMLKNISDGKEAKIIYFKDYIKLIG